MSSSDMILPVRACAAAADAETVDAGLDPGWIPSSSSPASGPAGAPSTDGKSSAGTDEEEEARLGQA